MLFIKYRVKWKDQEAQEGQCAWKDGCCNRLYELAVPASLESITIEDQEQFLGYTTSANTVAGLVLMHAQCVRNMQHQMNNLS